MDFNCRALILSMACLLAAGGVAAQEAPPSPAPAPYTPSAVPPPAAAFQPTALAPAGTATVPIHFRGSSGSRYRVDVSGAASGSCDLPCTLQLSPGLASVRVSGDVEFNENLDVPATEATVVVSRKKMGLFVTGVVLLGLGTINSVYLAATEKDSSQMSVGEAEQRLYVAIGALILVGTGAILILTSGSNSTSVERPRAGSSAKRQAGLRFGGAGFAPTPAGGGFAAARWVF
jgi:hypothetical protein